MKNETKEKHDYVEHYNQGYELSKELGLKPDILKDLGAGNNRIQAMKDGMEQYAKELVKEKEMNIIPSLDLDNLDSNYIDIDTPDKDKDIDLDI